MQIIVFSLGDKHYAISTDKVEEISKRIHQQMCQTTCWMD